MTILVWPEELPKPERRTWQNQRQDPRQKRKNENGPTGYSRRFSSVEKNVSLTITLTRQQKAIFDNFYEHETQHGSLLFKMPDPTTDGWALYASSGQPLLVEDGVPLLLSAEWLCLFGDATPSETIQGIEFVIRFSVKVMP